MAYVDYNPAAGFAERVCFATGWHDDNAAARDCSWAIIRGGGFTLMTAISTAYNVYRQLYQDTYWRQPLILRPGITLRFNVVGIAAGKFANINIFTEQLAGDDTYGF